MGGGVNPQKSPLNYALYATHVEHRTLPMA